MKPKKPSANERAPAEPTYYYCYPLTVATAAMGYGGTVTWRVWPCAVHEANESRAFYRAHAS